MNYPNKIPSNNLHDRIVYEIGLKIVSGQLKPGDVLPSAELLSSEFEISRTVVREALKTLTAKGLLEARPKIGTRVRPVQNWNLLDPDILLWKSECGPDYQFLAELIDVRSAIEPTAARLAAERATGSEIQAITAAYQQMEANVDKPDVLIDADMVFHEAIFTACHSHLLNQMAITIRHALRLSRKVTVKGRDQAASVESLPMHWAVVEAIAARNSGAAYNAMAYLIDCTATDIQQIIDQ